jgi:hypothetical protein
LLCLVSFALALLLGGTGYALRGYRLLSEETPVVDIDARISVAAALESHTQLARRQQPAGTGLRR